MKKKISEEEFELQVMALQQKKDDAKLYNDSDTVEERINEMTASNRRCVPNEAAILTAVQLRNASERMEKVLQLMVSLKIKPNVNQYTFAQVAVMNIINQRRIMLCIPPGQGKTRVIATIPFIAHLSFGV